MSQENWVRTALRVPRDLHERLHKTAEQRDRSFNNEIVSRLRGSLQLDGIAADGLGSISSEALLAELARRLNV